KNDFTIVDEPKDANIIVSVGGDGAFLQAVRKTGFRQDCLYTGITYSDEAGLYCDFNLDTFDDMLFAMEHEAMKVRRFPLIDVQINGNTSFHCLNEVSVRSTIIKSIVIDVFIDDKHVEAFRGGGLVVATPPGSTGCSKARHGAVVDPRIPWFRVAQVASLSNNRYRTLCSSFVLDQDGKLRLEIVQDGNEHPIVGLDNEAYSIRNIQDINVSLSDKVIKTVTVKNNSYWDRVKRTFL